MRAHRRWSGSSTSWIGAGARLSYLLTVLLIGGCPGPGEDTETASVSASEGSGTFLVLPDGVPVEECNPGAQDCPEGERCSPYLRDSGGCCVDSTHCAPVLGDKGLGEVCTRGVDNDDCTGGLFCMTDTSGGVGPGRCIELCDPGVSATCTDGLCIPFDDGFLPLCVTTCDPLAPACEEGQGCYVVVSEEVFVCLYSTQSAGGDNDPCTTLQDCAPGQVCFDGAAQQSCSADQCCTPVCDLGGDGSECKNVLEGCHSPYTVGQTPDDDDAGVCTVSVDRQQDPLADLLGL